MVKTQYQCEICNTDFDTLDDASKHEKIPILYGALPKGLVIVYGARYAADIVGKRTGEISIEHETKYNSLQVHFPLLESSLKSSAFNLTGQFRLSQMQYNYSKIHRPNEEQIAEIMKNILPSDSELEEIKRKIKQSGMEYRLETIEVTLEDLTNKIN